MGASTGLGGTGRAQADVRDTLAFPGAQSMAEPELYVSRAKTKFDQLRLTDEPTRAALRELLEALVAWTERLRTLTAAA